MTKQGPAIIDGRAGLVMFARGDRVFPVDDLGGGVWSRRGTVLSVHPVVLQDAPAAAAGVHVDATPATSSPCARASVLWDDGSAEVLAEDKLCLVYDQEAPIGIRVVTTAMSQPCDVVDHGGQVVLVLREGLLAPEVLDALRIGLGRVRAALTPGHSDATSVAELRRRDLNLLNALIAELTGQGAANSAVPAQQGRPRAGMSAASGSPGPAPMAPGSVMPGPPSPGSAVPGPVVSGPVRTGRPAAATAGGAGRAEHADAGGGAGLTSNTGIAVSRPEFVRSRCAAPGTDFVVGGDGPSAVERADVRVGRPDTAHGAQDVEYGPGRAPGP